MRAVVRNASIITILMSGILSGCASSNTVNSSWMSDYRKELKNKTLTQLMIPGTHYANAYNIDPKNHLEVCTGETLPASMSNNAKLAALVAAESDTEIHRDFIDYLNTQNNNIRGQLNNGIRYLELQICIQDATYYTSNYYLTENLDDVVSQIKAFLDENKNELIIIDLDNNLRAFYGYLNEDDLSNLHNYFQVQFGSYLTPKKDWQTTKMKDIWDTHHRIILFSSNQFLTRYYDVWDKNDIALAEPAPHYTTIKKLTAIQTTMEAESENHQQKFSLIPIYTWYNADIDMSNLFSGDSNDHLIINYLYSLPLNAPLNIVISDNPYNRQLVNYAIYKNTGTNENK